MKSAEIDLEVRKMIVMDVRIDNFFLFKNFHMNMSYPKKIVDSSIEDEFLEGRSNFRYKKVNILMGANATGKTSFGRFLMRVFNFMDKKQFERITECISNMQREASFTMDFVTDEFVLYRIHTLIAPKSGEKYVSSDVDVTVKKVEINKKDSYESCCKKLELLTEKKADNYIVELEKIKGLSWLFEYPSDSQNQYKIHTSKNGELYLHILEYTLKALDPAILKVDKIDTVDNSYVIRMENKSIIMQEGKTIDSDILSSGTKAGIAIAGVLASIINGDNGFYYCDEKFSYIHSEIEKAFLAVMIQSLHRNDQLFFTTHNMDILDLELPKHSFSFLKKNVNNCEEPLTCIYASDFLKRSTDSLRNAVDNDLFSVAPSVDLVYDIVGILENKD